MPSIDDNASPNFIALHLLVSEVVNVLPEGVLQELHCLLQCFP